MTLLNTFLKSSHEVCLIHDFRTKNLLAHSRITTVRKGRRDTTSRQFSEDERKLIHHSRTYILSRLSPWRHTRINHQFFNRLRVREIRTLDLLFRFTRLDNTANFLCYIRYRVLDLAPRINYYGPGNETDGDPWKYIHPSKSRVLLVYFMHNSSITLLHTPSVDHVILRPPVIHKQRKGKKKK